MERLKKLELNVLRDMHLKQVTEDLVEGVKEAGSRLKGIKRKWRRRERRNRAK